MPDHWKDRVWTAEETLALSGLGPVWRLARAAVGHGACPACGAAQWVRCSGAALHVDRVFAAAAVMRAVGRAPPMAADVRPVADLVVALGIPCGEPVSRREVGADEAFDLAVAHGLLALRTENGPERWVLSEYGAACWCNDG